MADISVIDTRRQPRRVGKKNPHLIGAGFLTAVER